MLSVLAASVILSSGVEMMVRIGGYYCQVFKLSRINVYGTG